VVGAASSESFYILMEVFQPLSVFKK